MPHSQFRSFLMTARPARSIPSKGTSVALTKYSIELSSLPMSGNFWWLVKLLKSLLTISLIFSLSSSVLGGFKSWRSDTRKAFLRSESVVRDQESQEVSKSMFWTRNSTISPFLWNKKKRQVHAASLSPGIFEAKYCFRKPTYSLFWIALNV